VFNSGTYLNKKLAKGQAVLMYLRSHSVDCSRFLKSVETGPVICAYLNGDGGHLEMSLHAFQTSCLYENLYPDARNSILIDKKDVVKITVKKQDRLWFWKDNVYVMDKNQPRLLSHRELVNRLIKKML
jgi:hypothetical protein